MGWVQLLLAENESNIYPNMFAKFGCGPTVVSKKGGYRHTDRQPDKGTLHVYIVDSVIGLHQCFMFACLFVCMCICLPMCLSMCLFSCLVVQYVYQYACLSLFLSI